ncbi:ABC transporter substrate-binding protein [Microbacterium elymi]|uniref:ABC transporter substrate-binding protein n=1 Tax=Microbacterium elymi TaxID=2909587 RepID=A0ABY5NNN9_9MICO|nr:ABC transporter substrate-binding protein [Microbacterium elymi]UUT36656.1 ABC transporter substrate-binding protein [Microbacterium elymi]
MGYIAALTGGSATLGIPAQHGIELAIKKINDSGELDRKLELVAVDDAADATKSASATQKMVDEQDVVAVLGGPNSGTVLANNPIITGAGVVELITVAQADNLIDPDSAGYDLTYQVTENNTYNVGATVQFFLDANYKKICAVADTTEYGQSGIASIRTVFGDNGLKVAKVVTHEVNATDLTPQVLSLRDAKCDAIYLYDYGQDAAVFMKTVHQIGWNVDVIGGRALNQAAFLSIAGSAGDGLIFPSVIDLDKQSAKDFISAYTAVYGDDDPAQTFSALGYDSVLMLAKALKASDYKGGKPLAEALNALTLDDGATGREGSTLSFTPGDHRAPSDDYQTFWTIKDGKYAMYSNTVPSTRP